MRSSGVGVTIERVAFHAIDASRSIVTPSTHPHRSHLWTSYIIDRASVTPAAQLELLFSGFCAVSGSPVYPSDYKRYRLRLKHSVTGVDEVGFMYYCCWPCVCGVGFHQGRHAHN